MTPEEIITEMNWTYDSDPGRYALWCNLIRPAMINYAASQCAAKDAKIADLEKRLKELNKTLGEIL